jgi:S1-C subfamily serine protease
MASDQASSIEQLERSLIDVAVEDWRFSKLFAHSAKELEVGEGQRYVDRPQDFLKKVQKSLAASGPTVFMSASNFFMHGLKGAGRILTAATLVALATCAANAQIPTRAADALLGSGAESGSGPTTGLLGPNGAGSLQGVTLPPARATEVLNSLQPDAPSSRRGAREVQLYRRVAPSVVLVVTDSGIGSGTLLNSNGDILTNWHVVGQSSTVGVIFKPAQDRTTITKADIRPARVIRIDEVADLALIRVNTVPAEASPVPLGQAKDVDVGSDVHAIGHPTGEAWTYTKGVVSAVRPSYKWTTESKISHQATVIQTQTPINPGNSGGPLLTDDGKLIGVNSFKAQGEALNFAVAVDELQRFLASNESRVASRPAQAATGSSGKGKCEAKDLYTRDNKKDGYEATGVDLDCDGKVDAELRVPYDQSEPVTIVFDRNGDRRPDVIVFSFKRDGSWDLSFVDTDYDGKWDLVGTHRNGEIKPVSHEPYAKWAARTR